MDRSDFENTLGELVRDATTSGLERGMSIEEASAALAESISKGTKDAGEMVVETLIRDAPRMLKAARRDRTAFEQSVERTWGPALDRCQAVLVCCGEAGEMLLAKLERPSNYQIEALAGLHARAWQTSHEVMTLLRAGFSQGAAARARTMMEIATTAFLLAEWGKTDDHTDLAERFLLHDTVMRYKEAVVYQQNAPVLGYELFSGETMEQLENNADEVTARFGPGYSSSFGWAAKLCGVKTPRYSDLEKLAGSSHMRSFYGLTSHSVHAGSRGSALNAKLANGTKVFRAGPSLLGLADPAQLSNIAFAQTTASLLAGGQDEMDFTELVIAEAILKLVDHANADLVAVETSIRSTSES